MRSAVCLIVLFWARPAMAQGNTCSDAEVNRTVAAIGMARQELLALPIGDGLDINVSTEARRAVGLMKSSLNDMVAAYMQCVPTSAQPDPKSIEKDLSALVHAFSLPAGFIKNEDLPKDFGKYGFELSFDVKATKDARRLVSITATFAIECGSDTMLLIFSPSGNFWKEVLRWQSPPYDTVAGAFGAFDYRISAADPTGRWYIVAKSIRPWCSSTWSNIDYAVLRPVPDNSTPKVLLSGSDSIWWGNEDFGALLVNASEFDLRFHSYSIDSGVHNRVYVRRYKVVDDHVTRIQPVAVSPRDFVDEWIISPWAEASQWSSPKESAKLRRRHEELHALEESHSTDFSYHAVRRCSDAQDHYQVSVFRGQNQVFYFQLKGSTAVTMIAVSGSPDSRCKGANLLSTMDTH